MADRTVTVRVRLNVRDVIASARAGGAAIEGMADEVDTLGITASKTKRETEGLGDTVGDTGRKFRNTSRTTTLMRRELVSLVAGAVALAPAVIAAGAAFGAFAGAAVPSLIKVIGAQENLAEHWSSLTGEQRAAAVGLADLIDQYQDLSASIEPQTLAVFNTAVNTASDLMEDLTPLVHESADAFVDLADRMRLGAQSQEWQEFIQFLTANAAPSVDALGDALGSIAALLREATEALMPLSMVTLRAVGGVADLTAGLIEANPELAQMAIAMIALRAPMAGLGGLIGRASGGFKDFAKTTRGASLSTKAFNVAARAGPNLYLAAGLAVAFFTAKVVAAQTSTEQLVDTLRESTDAVGNNLAGYQALEDELSGRLTVAQRKFDDVLVGTSESGKALAKEIRTLKSELGSTRESITNITRGADLLARELGVTRGEAIQLANAAGVDLSEGITGSGDAAIQARDKIDQYRAAVELSADPTRAISEAWDTAANQALTLKDRVDALQLALESYFNPSLAVFEATTQVKEAFQDLNEALQESKGRMSGNSEAALAARDAFATALTATAELGSATFRLAVQQGRSETAHDEANAAMAEQLPVLLALAGNNKGARAQVDALAVSLGVARGRSDVSRESFLATAKTMGFERDKAEALWREFQKIPKQSRTNVTTPGMSQAIGQAMALESTISSIPRNVRISMHVRTSSSLVGPGFMGGVAEGGIRRRQRGGVDVPAHIARAPTVLFGEPETGGEAFIPLASSKRARSTAILDEVAREFGLGLVRRMQHGGMVAANFTARPAPQGGAQPLVGTLIQQTPPGATPREALEETMHTLRVVRRRGRP